MNDRIAQLEETIKQLCENNNLHVANIKMLEAKFNKEVLPALNSDARKLDELYSLLGALNTRLGLLELRVGSLIDLLQDATRSHPANGLPN